MEEKKKRILIIDDDKSIGEMLQTLLEFNGFKAFVVDKPQGIEQKIKEHEIDLIILDMRLSGADGTEVCAALKSEESTKEVPILMMSALYDAGATCKTAGAEDFISKPFEMDELLVKVKEMVG